RLFFGDRLRSQHIVRHDCGAVIAQQAAETSHARQAADVIEMSLDEFIMAAFGQRGRRDDEPPGAEEVDRPIPPRPYAPPVTVIAVPSVPFAAGGAQDDRGRAVAA